VNSGISIVYAVAVMACVTASAMPCSPSALGCIGAAGDAGTSGSIQRRAGSEHASWPRDGV